MAMRTASCGETRWSEFSAAKKMALLLPRFVFDENRFVAPKISRKLLSYQRLSLKGLALVLKAVAFT